MTRAAIRALGVRVGQERRENAFYLEHFPDVVRGATQKSLAKAFSAQGTDEHSRGYDEEMAQYVEDPFRGAKVRYVLGSGETTLGLELDAAKDALAAARMEPSEIDLILCASWLPEFFVAPGNAVFHAGALGIRAPAWNVESACSSGLAALQMAQGLIAAGSYRNILVVLSSTNSRHTSNDDTLGWISSDVAAAAVVAPGKTRSEGLGAGYMVNTAETCGVFVHELVPTEGGGATVRMGVGSKGSAALRASTGPELVRRCVKGALSRNELGLRDIHYFGFSTPLAWYAKLCVRALEIDRERTLDLFPRYGNVGAPFPLFNLYHALTEGKLDEGDRAVLFTVGSVSSAGALVLRAGAIAVGPHPEARR